MENDKREIVQIIDGITNPKLVNYLLNLIKTFIELRS